MSNLRTLGGLMRSPVLPVTTWVNRPAANGFPAGTILPVVWYDGRTLHFIADPENNRWRPQNGVMDLYVRVGTNVSTPLATLTGDGTDKVFTLPVDCLIPAGMLYPHSILTVGMILRKFGTHTGVIESRLSTTASNFTSPVPNIISANTSNAAAQTWHRGSADAIIRNGGFYSGITLSIASSMSTGASTSQYVDRTDANILTEDRYVIFIIRTTYTDSAAELHAYTVQLRG